MHGCPWGAAFPGQIWGASSMFELPSSFAILDIGLHTSTEKTMVDILHPVGVEAPASPVFTVLATRAGLAGWWTEFVVNRWF